MQIELSNRELQLLHAALLACTRSGGGSQNWTLCMKLGNLYPEELDLDLVRQQSEICISEAEEAGEITRT